MSGRNSSWRATLTCAIIAALCLREAASGAAALQDSQATAPSAAAAAAPAPAPNTFAGLPVLQPQATFTFPPGVSVKAIVAAPDGQNVYVLTEVPAINIWALIVYWSPEILCALAALALLWLMGRIGKRAQIIGQPHCRKCNYALVNLDGAANCPECGAPLGRRGRLIGKRRKPQIITLAALLVIYGALYFSDGLSRMRHSDAREWFHWCSESLAAIPPRHPIMRFLRGGDSITQVYSIGFDLQHSAQILRRPGMRPRGIDVSRDGETVLVWSDADIIALHADTAAVVRQVGLHDVPGNFSWPDGINDARLSGDSTMMIVLLSTGTLYSWQLTSERPRELAAIDRSAAGLHQRFLSRGSAPATIAVMDWAAAQPRVLLFDENEQHRVVPLGGEKGYERRPVSGTAVSADNTRIYEASPDGVHVYGVQNGQRIQVLPIRPTFQSISVSPDDKWMCGRTWPGFRIYSMDHGDWVAQLPNSVSPDQVAISRDSSTLMLAPVIRMPGRTQVQLEVYNLSSVLSPANGGSPD